MTDFRTYPAAEIFPMLSDSELRELADDIKLRGLLQPIVMYDGMVLDGRNRLLACRLAGVEPRFVTYSGDDPLGYVISLNLHRRHLTTEQRAIVASRLANLHRGKPVNAHTCAITQSQAAEALSVSRRSVQHARAIEKEPELVEQVWRGEKSLTQAAREINAAKIEERREMHREKQRASVPLPTPESPSYRVIYADPPWKYGSANLVSRDLGMAEDKYPTMALSELKALPVRDMAMPDSVLFLWATSPLLPDALELMDAWGFTHKSSIVWDKGRPFLGSYVHISHELLLIGTRGSCVADNPVTTGSVVRIPRAGHSEKPDAFRDMIDSMYTFGNRIELFRRGEAPDGWDVWGNEAV